MSRLPVPAGRFEALDVALALARMPELGPLLRSRPLPSGMALAIRVAGGCETSMREAAGATGLAPCDLQAAARCLVQHAMLFEGASACRLLGIHGSAPVAEARSNLRWLMAWLHPDRSGSDWHQAQAARVLAGWQAYRRADRAGFLPSAQSRAHAKARRAWVARPLEPEQSGRWLSTSRILAAAAFAAVLVRLAADDAVRAGVLETVSAWWADLSDLVQLP